MARSDLLSGGKSFVRRPNANRADTSIPIRSEAPPPLRQPTRVQRAKTLTKPERHQPQVPLINPQNGGPGGFSDSNAKGKSGSGTWTVMSQICTFWALGPCLGACGLKDKSSRQAWREKVTLVIIALCLGGCIGFLTMGLNAALCPTSATLNTRSLAKIGDGGSTLGVNGWEMNITSATLPGANDVGYSLYTLIPGTDVTFLFKRDEATYYPSCIGKTGLYATSDTCVTAGNSPDCPLGDLDSNTLAKWKMTNDSRRIGYGWEDMADSKYSEYLVLDGVVLNLGPYLAANQQANKSDMVDVAIRLQLESIPTAGGKDATRMFNTRTDLKAAIPCLKQKYLAGYIDKITPGCFVANLFLYASLIVILGLVVLRFLMAIYFSWFLSWRMSSPSKRRPGGVGHHTLPSGAMTNVNSSGAAPWANKQRPPPSAAPKQRLRHDGSDDDSLASMNRSLTSTADVGNEPFIVCLVTCYSEGEEGISNTLTSLAGTDYPDSRKLLFVVADGMVTGSGESMSTPDICVGMLEADARFGTPMPMSFVSVAQGSKQHNMAMVYAGHYTKAKGHRVPLVVVVKCGSQAEAKAAKPGNRGKRDSQMILMNFFQRVTYNDRMSPLDFDLFRKLHSLMGVTPDFFELCMMVDADTLVYPASMRLLTNCMMKDHLIMGVCGETRIANKTASWVTMIQVYEYFISHHMVKAFESVFGGVTCLPGCFSMYRIKSRKPADDDWVPIIVKPEITREYSQSTVTTLHQKNLLLLGEDRFLSTTLLRTFPTRKMVFCPQARCRTEVPHTFKMLLSQRRRWINSTIHNLMELVLVRDLCGTFCFSMQFVVFMDLLGTAVLPISIALTYTLAVTYALNPPHSFTEAIPLMLLCSVIGLPAVLILLATRKVVYVLWMLVYLVALPVWNFALPIYSFWHFDDFSWGETRKVEGEAKSEAHGDGEGEFNPNTVPLRRWEDWERSRLRKLKREERRRQDLEGQFGQGFHNDGSPVQHPNPQNPQMNNNRGPPPPPGFRPGGPPMHGGIAGPGAQQLVRDSDSWSDSGSDLEEDKWGAQIGGYDESAPPPLAIVRHSVWMNGQEVILDQRDMEDMMEKGWDDEESSGIHRPGQPVRPSAANAARRSRFDLGDTPVPKIPSRFGAPQNGNPSPQGYGGQSFPNDSTASFGGQSNGEYTSLMRGAASPAANGGSSPFGDDVGRSSAVGSGAPQSHTRNRSGGAAQQGGLQAPQHMGMGPLRSQSPRF